MYVLFFPDLTHLQTTDSTDEEVKNVGEETMKEDGEFEVEEIVSYKYERGMNFFKIHWKGCDESQDSWEH